MAHAPHWYDLNLVFSRKFTGAVTHNVQELADGSRNLVKHTYFGAKGVRKNYQRQISRVVREHHESTDVKLPVVFGECGVPMDLNGGVALVADGDYTHHTLAMDATLRAFESNMVSGYALWNYNPNNTHAAGDEWNGENFSIYSRDCVTGIGEPTFDGGRCLAAVLRCRVLAVAGQLVMSKFSMKKLTFRMQFESQPGQSGVTDIYVPQLHYRLVDGELACVVEVSDGKFEFDA